MGSKHTKIIYADYDYKTSKYSLKFGKAVIEKNGSAMIQNGVFGVIERRAGEYVTAEHFEHSWKICIKNRAEEMAQQMTSSENSEVKVIIKKREEA